MRIKSGENSDLISDGLEDVRREKGSTKYF